MSMGGWFLAASIWGAAFTVNAFRPRTRWQTFAPSFFAQWVTLEMAPLHLAWQGIATALFVRAGALGDGWGVAGLIITLVSWVGILVFIRESLRARHIAYGAVQETLGTEVEHWDTPNTLNLVFPLRLNDRSVERIKNLRYAPGAGSRHLLDVLRTKGTERGARKPVLLQIHGGGWVIGDKSQQGYPLMMELARRGWVCVAINYRLSPKSQLPDHLLDCKLALAWIREHIEEYGGDPEFVAVTGGSAGGHLAAMVALTPNDPAYQPDFENIDTTVQAAVPIYGVYDFHLLFNAPNVGAQRVADRFARMIAGATISEDPDRFTRLSPINRVGPHAPPTLLVHGTNDTLSHVDQARSFEQALRTQSNQPVGYIELPGASHAFEVFHSVRTHHVVNGIAAFLESTYEVWKQRRRCATNQEAHRDGSNDPTPTSRTARQ